MIIFCSFAVDILDFKYADLAGAAPEHSVWKNSK